MFGFNFIKNDVRYGAVIDIGSNSVSAAIVSSVDSEKDFQIIWSHKENPLKFESSDQEKNIVALIHSCFNKIGTDGVKKLSVDTRAKGKLKTLLVTISAPYTQTVAKKVVYKKDRPFVVTEKLVSELEMEAKNTANQIIKESGVVDELNFVPMTHRTTSIKLNDYVVNDPYDKEVSRMEFIHITGMGSKNVLDAIKEGKRKNLPGVKSYIQPFIGAFYEAIMSLKPVTNDMLMVNVTATSTEIGLIEDGCLDEIFSVPVGEYTIASAVSSEFNTGFSESIGYMRQNNVMNNESTKKEGVKQSIKLYEDFVHNSISKLKSSKSLPKVCYVHTSSQTEPFFAERIKSVTSKENIDIDMEVYPVSNGLFTKVSKNSNLSLSAYVFHKCLYLDKSFRN